MFGSVGVPELIIIFTIALIIFGPRKLPELGKSLGKSLGGVQAGLERAEEYARRRDSHRGAASRASARRARPAAHPVEPSSRPSSAQSVPRQNGSAEAQMALVPFPGATPERGRDGDPDDSTSPFGDDEMPAERCRFWSISTSSGNG